MTNAPEEPHALRILIVDDHPAVREGLALLVSSEGMEVSGEAERRADVVGILATSRPDVAIVDLSLDADDGLPVLSDLAARGVPALVYSMHGDSAHVRDAFAAGALGYVTKAEFRGVLVEAIVAVAAGRRFVSPRTALALAEGASERARGEELAQLSPKEREVHRLMGRGEGAYEIAAALGISTHTVESYYARLQQKLGLDGMYELRRHAIDHYRQRDR